MNKIIVCVLILSIVTLGCIVKDPEPPVSEQSTIPNIQQPQMTPKTDVPYKGPLWSQDDITSLNGKMRGYSVSIYNETYYQKPPFYNGKMPIEIMTAFDDYGDFLFIVFDDFIVMYVYDDIVLSYDGIPNGAMVMGRDENPIPRAEAKIISEIRDNENGNRAVDILEIHYDKYDNAIYNAKSTIEWIEGDRGYKTEEYWSAGTKKEEYFFMYPLGFSIGHMK